MSYGRTSVFVAGLTLPATLVLGGLVTWWLKSSNPDDVDITAGLAYLRPILLTSIGVFVALALVALVTGVLGLRRDSSPELARLGLLLLAVVTVLSIAAGAAGAATGDAEDDYRREHSAATS